MGQLGRTVQLYSVMWQLNTLFHSWQLSAVQNLRKALKRNPAPKGSVILQ